jgi:type IV pilus assembly protein PilE
MHLRSTRGFTLIELMVVVAVIALLAAFAMYSYGNYAFRVRRAEGREMLLRMASQQERFYTNFNRYGTAAELGFTGTVLSSEGNYQIDIVRGANNLSYVLNGVPQGKQAQDKCATLTLTEAGVRGPAPAATHTNGACW